MTCGILISLDIASYACFIYFFFCNEKICLLHNVLGNSHKNKNAGPLLEVLDKGINQFLLEQA